MAVLFFRELAQFGLGWQVWLAGAGVLALLAFLVMIPLLRRPKFSGILGRTLMNGSTLYGRLLVGFRLVAIVPVLTLLPLLAVISTATVEDVQRPQVERLAESLALSVPPLIEGKVTGLESLSGHITAAGHSAELALSAALLRHHVSSPEFASLWIAQATGEVVVATAIKDGKAAPWSGPVAGVAMLDSFKRAVIAGERYLSPVEKGANADAAPMMFISVPVALNGDSHWGFVQGLLNLQEVVGGLVAQGTADSVSAIITDQRNRVILTSPGLALAPFSDLSGHPLVTAATTEASGDAYGFSGIVNNDGTAARYIAFGRSLENGWRVFTTATQAKANLTLLIYMSLGLIWALLAIVLARGLAPLYGEVVAEPLQRLEESLDEFDMARTISIIPSPPTDAPQEIRQTYTRVRKSMRNSRDAYRNMMKAVNEGLELREKLSVAKSEGSAGADVPAGPVSGKRPSGAPKLAVAEEPSTPDTTWIGRIDSVTELSGLDVFEGFFGEAWNLGVTDSRPMAVLLLRVSATDDQMLKLIAQRLKVSVGRTLDLVARIGAWEFGMILPDTDLNGALSVADKLCQVLQGEITEQSPAVSLGVGSIIPNAKGNAQSFLDLCHRALAAAHQAGEGQIAYVTDKGKVSLHSRTDMIDWDPGATGMSG